MTRTPPLAADFLCALVPIGRDPTLSEGLEQPRTRMLMTP